MALELTTFKTAEETARALALQVGKDLQQALAAHIDAAARALLLLSGGRSPLTFFPILAQQNLPWQQIDVSLVDDRSVPPQHEDSNARLIREYLLQGAAKSAKLLPLMAEDVDESDPWRWAQRSAEIANTKKELTHPAVVILGLGLDGHTASLFPDSPQWPHAMATHDRYVAVQPGNAPHARVSMSLHALIEQRVCYVWSNGADKLDLIKKIWATTSAVNDHLIDGNAMHDAGPFAILAAHPDVTLKVFHSEV